LAQHFYLRSEDKSKGAGRIFAAVFFGFFSLIITSFVFWTHYSSKERDELTKNGILVKGTILSGFGFSYDEKNVGAIEVYFKTKDGKDVYVKESIDKEEFANLHENQKVDLIYSPKDPHMIALILTAADVEKYLKIKQRDLLAQDLVEFLYCSKDELGNKLQQAHRFWKYNATDSAWINNELNAAVNLQPGKMVRYISRHQSILSMSDEFKGLGYSMKEYGPVGSMKCDTDSISILIEQEYTSTKTSVTILKR
jgi:cold shock CspA family protein